MLLYLLKRNNVSAAMFAPGWVYETAQQPNFNSAQNKWWSLVEKSCGIVQTIHKSSLFTRISIRRALVTMFHSKVSNSQIVAFSFILHRCMPHVDLLDLGVSLLSSDLRLCYMLHISLS